jgi:MFS family permease
MNTPLAWLVCFSAALFFFYAFIQMTMFNAVSPMLYKEFHANSAQMGLLVSSYFYADVPCLLIAGMVLDRFSTRKVLLMAVAVAVIGTFIFAFSEHMWQATIGRFFVGGACAFCFLSIVRLVSRWFTSNHMALVIGLVVTLAFAGGMVAQTPLAILTRLHGWRFSMIINGVLGIVIFALVFLLVKDAPSGKIVEEQKKQLQLMGFWKGIIGVIDNLQNWLGGIYTSATNLAVFILSSFGALYLTQIIHYGTLTADNIVTVFFLGLMIGSPLFGYISDKMQNRKIPMLIGAFILLVSLITMLYWVHISAVWMGAIFFFIGFSSGAQVLGYPLIAESNSPALTATAESLASALIMAGGLTNWLVGSLLQHHWDHTVVNSIPVYSLANYRYAFAILPIAVVIAIIAVFFSKETHAKNICE